MVHRSLWTCVQLYGVLIILVTPVTSCGPWDLSEASKLKTDQLTAQQLANKGEVLIFGELGERHTPDYIGKAQCPVCHAFQPGHHLERAPSLWGITARRRHKETPIAYLAESHVCPNCYVVAGWGLKGSQGCESPMPKVHLPPINLTIEELVAVDTWIYVHEDETPPSPSSIKQTYKRILSEPEWNYVNRRGENDTSVQVQFYRHGCATCHTIQGIPGATGTIGPTLSNMKTKASLRIDEPSYQGSAASSKEYIVESILYHDRYVVPDKARYTNNTLPSSYYQNTITAKDLQLMTDYLAQLEHRNQPESTVESAVTPCVQDQPSRIQ